MELDLIIEVLNRLEFPDDSSGPKLLLLPDPDGLRFNPDGEMAWVQEKLEDTPRYLFRIVCPDIPLVKPTENG